jgi:hypothetical protein
MTMSAASLIQCLAGDLMADPGILFETIREEEDLVRTIRNYRHGDIPYSEVLDTVKDFI